MKKVMVDTDVVSFAFREDSRFAFYEEIVQGSLVYISFMTYAELWRGTLRANWGQRRQTQLLEFVKTRYGILNANRDTCYHWAELTDQARRQGKVLQCADGWVAASAVAADLPLLTHNSRDFSYLSGLTVVSSG